MNPQLAKAVEFIWLEADLLDQRDYSAWLTLWDEAGLYIVPTDAATTDFENSVNYAYDNAAMRDMRVRRLTSGQSMSASHAATTVRTVSRFRLLDERTDTVLHVRCAQHLVEYKFGKHRTYAADVTWILRQEGSNMYIVRKIVRLSNAGDALAGITFLP
jgi:3-phenylpropionate/cinnamic acid dioxygenase small subunit